MALSRSLKTHYLCRINWGNWGQIPINLLTPCRLGRRSPPLRGNVRVGPPAMSFVRSLIFLRLGNWGQIPINLLTPRRLGRRSPPLRGNVRVGPPAMSFVRSLIFLRLHFCSATIQNDSFNETASNP
jgi:hypothetical protein